MGDLSMQVNGANPSNMSDLNGAGTVQTTQVSGGTGKAMIIETGIVQGKINNIIQFSIDNTGVGNAAQQLRIGSRVGLPDAFARYGMTAGAADNAVIEDDFGAGCLKVQGFSDIISMKPVVVSEVKIITPTADSQLQQAIKYKSLQLDGSVDETTKNVAFTQRTVDNRDNLINYNGTLILDAQQFIDYRILAAKTVDVFLKITGFANVDTFLPVTE